MTQDLWVHFSHDQLLEYLGKLGDPEAAAGYLAGVLKLDNYRFDARQAILLDYSSYALDFAKQQGYGPTRTASWYNVAHRVLQACTSGAAYAECEATFKGLMLQLVRPRPSMDSPYFSPDQVAAAAGFMARGLLRHYRLYQFVFSHDQGHTEYTAELMVETPVVPSFEAALSQADWDAMKEQRRLEAEAAQKAAEEVEAARLAEEARVAEEEAKLMAEEARRNELTKKPSTLEEAIEQLVALRLEAEREALAAQFKGREDALLGKIAALESARGAKPASATPKKA